MASPCDEVPELLSKLYAVVRRLEELFPERRFTPDGILAGHLGEVLAARDYALKLLPQGTPVHDAETTDGTRKVQIRMTQRGESLEFSDNGADWILAVRMDEKGRIEEIYNGPNSLLKDEAQRKQRKMSRAGYFSLTVRDLRGLMEKVPGGERLPRIC